MPLAALGIFGPLCAATVLTAKEGGRQALAQLFGGLLKWRVGWHWYLVALLLPGILLAGALGLLRLAGRTGDVLLTTTASAVAVAGVIAVAEEIGWRGFALPRLQKRVGPIAASGAIGGLWTLWHIPMFLGAGVQLALLPVMLLYFVGGSFVFTWINNRTGSLLLVVLAHVGAHLNNSHAALPGDELPVVVHAIIYAALGMLVMRAQLRTGGRGHSASSQRATDAQPYTDVETDPQQLGVSQLRRAG